MNNSQYNNVDNRKNKKNYNNSLMKILLETSVENVNILENEYQKLVQENKMLQQSVGKWRSLYYDQAFKNGVSDNGYVGEQYNEPTD